MPIQAQLWLSTLPLRAFTLANVSKNLRIIRYFLNYQLSAKYRWVFLAVVVLTLGYTLSLSIMTPLAFKELIDKLNIARNTTSFHFSETYGAISIVFFWIILSVILRAMNLYAILYLRPRIRKDVEDDCFEIFHKFSYQFYISNFVGSFVSKMRRFAEGYMFLEYTLLDRVWPLAVRVAGIFVVLSISAPILIPVMLIWVCVFHLAMRKLLIRKAHTDQIYAEMDSKVSGQLADSVTNFLNTKIFSAFRREEASFRNITATKCQTLQKCWYDSLLIFCSNGAVNIIAQFFILTISVWLWSKGDISIGTVVLIQTFMLQITDVLNDLSSYTKEINRCLAGTYEMMDLIERDPIIKDPDLPETCQMPSGDIRLESVQFAYDEDGRVFDNLNLHIPAGQKVGLVGVTGSGKTTLVRLLLRFMDIQSGKITIDGQDITSVKQDDLRGQISMIPQEPVLFHRSLAENIAYGRPDALPAEIEDASRKAQAHEFISGLKLGYDTLVGERGVKLSGGQRQRVALARAILKDAPIVLMDEATSALDSITEKAVVDALDHQFAGKTVIVVAHRLSTVSHLDRIIVMQDGHVIEDGPHDTLLKNKDGTYARLYTQQRNGFFAKD